jgi:hypothetical protein
MNSTELEKALKSIGKKSFVEDFTVYSKSSLSKNEKVTMLSEKYSENGAMIRVSFAEKIFLNKLDESALEIIIDSPRIENIIREKATLLLASLKK